MTPVQFYRERRDGYRAAGMDGYDAVRQATQDTIDAYASEDTDNVE